MSGLQESDHLSPEQESPPSQLLAEIALEGEAQKVFNDGYGQASGILFMGGGLLFCLIQPKLLGFPYLWGALALGACMFGWSRINRHLRARRMRELPGLAGPMEIRRIGTGQLSPHEAFEVTVEQRAHRTLTIDRAELTLMLVEQRFITRVEGEGASYFVVDIRLWAETCDVLSTATVAPGMLLSARHGFVLPDTEDLVRKADSDFEATLEKDKKNRWASCCYDSRDIDWRLLITVYFADGSVRKWARLLQKVRHLSCVENGRRVDKWYITYPSLNQEGNPAPGEPSPEHERPYMLFGQQEKKPE